MSLVEILTDSRDLHTLDPAEARREPRRNPCFANIGRPICGEAMLSGLRYRFWMESTFAFITGVLAVITLFWRGWIEAVFGADPDKGSGAAEWLVVSVLLLLTVALATGSRREWRRSLLVE